MSAWQDFQTWVQQNLETGTNFCGFREVKYVPYPLLSKYWEKDNRIQEVLNQAGLHFVDPTPKEILESYIRIFSTLVYIHQAPTGVLNTTTVNYITSFHNYSRNSMGKPKRFNDDNLWLSATEEAAKEIFSEGGGGTEICKVFRKAQYIFNHVIFKPKSPRHYNVDDFMILPIQFEGDSNSILSDRRGQPTVKIYKLRKGSGITSDDKIVVKEYPDRDLSYMNETTAYSTLQTFRAVLLDDEDPTDPIDNYFLRYFGYFEQDKKGFLLLEHANHRSLEHFFETTSPPRNFEELHSFWSSLSRTIVGVKLLHPHGVPGDIEGAALKMSITRKKHIYHQDLKPANIFVFKDTTNNPGPRNQFSYQFKIGDLGSSSVKLPKAADGSATHQDNMSTRMYSAPELIDLEGVTGEADIWSLGCVLLEAAVWAVNGESGLDVFFEKRKEETLDAKEHWGAFHKNGEELEAIEETKIDILKSRRLFDNLTEGVIDIIMENMLVIEPKDRRKAGRILKLMQGLISKSKRDYDAQSKGPVSNPPKGKGKELEQRSTPTPPQKSCHLNHSVTNASQPVNLSESTTRKKELEHNNNYNGKPQLTPSVRTPRNSENSSSSRLQPERQPARTPPQESTHALPSGTNTSAPRLSEKQVVQASNPSPEWGKTENNNNCERVLLVQIMKYWEHERNSIRLRNVPKIPPGLNDVVKHFKTSEDRKNVIILDDSQSMQLSNHHWAGLSGVFQAIVCFIRALCPGKDKEIELYFTSQQPPKCISDKKAKVLVTDVEDILIPRLGGNTSKKGLAGFVGKFKKSNPAAGIANIPITSENSLAAIVSHIKSRMTSTTPRGPHPEVKIYLLTDGVWEQGDGRDLEGLVGGLKSLRSNPGVPPVSVSVRVIRFEPPDGRTGFVGDLVRGIEDDEHEGLNITVKDFDREDVWEMVL